MSLILQVLDYLYRREYPATAQRVEMPKSDLRSRHRDKAIHNPERSSRASITRAEFEISTLVFLRSSPMPSRVAMRLRP